MPKNNHIHIETIIKPSVRLVFLRNMHAFPHSDISSSGIQENGDKHNSIYTGSKALSTLSTNDFRKKYTASLNYVNFTGNQEYEDKDLWK